MLFVLLPLLVPPLLLRLIFPLSYNWFHLQDLSETGSMTVAWAISLPISMPLLNSTKNWPWLPAPLLLLKSPLLLVTQGNNPPSWTSSCIFPQWLSWLRLLPGILARSLISAPQPHSANISCHHQNQSPAPNPSTLLVLWRIAKIPQSCTSIYCSLSIWMNIVLLTISKTHISLESLHEAL